MFQAGMKRDFLSSPSFGSGIVRKGIYLMGVFLHSSEHWLVVMASVMTQILCDPHRSQYLLSHRHHHHQVSPLHVMETKFTIHLKTPSVFLNLGQKGANENLLCFNYVFSQSLVSRGCWSGRNASHLTPTKKI